MKWKGRRPKPREPNSTFRGKFSDDREIFERQLFDTDPQWSAFVKYRDTDPDKRSLRVLSERIGQDRGLSKFSGLYREIQNWSAHNGWRIRVEAWDHYIDREQRKQAVREAIAMRRRHADIGKNLQAAGVAGLRKLLTKAEKNGGELTLTASDIRGLIDLGVRTELQANGEPGAIVEERQKVTTEEKREGLLGLLKDREALSAAKILVKKLENGRT